MVSGAASPGFFDAALLRRQTRWVLVGPGRWSRISGYFPSRCLLVLEAFSTVCCSHPSMSLAYEKQAITKECFPVS
jgi:hypothetical protein